MTKSDDFAKGPHSVPWLATREAMLPQTFYSKNDDATGAAVYFTIVIVLSITCYAMIGGLIHALLTPWAIDGERLGKLLFYFLLPLVTVVISWFAIVDYRRRCQSRLDVLQDSFVLSSRFRCFSLSHEEIIGVQITSVRGRLNCVLELRDGKRFPIPGDVAVFDELRPALEPSLIPHLSELLQRRLESGERIPIAFNRLRAFLMMARGLVGWVVGIAFVYLVPLFPLIPGVKASTSQIVRGWRAFRHRAELSNTGVTYRGRLYATTSIESIHETGANAHIRFEQGDSIVLPILASNYLASVAWLRHYAD